MMSHAIQVENLPYLVPLKLLSWIENEILLYNGLYYLISSLEINIILTNMKKVVIKIKLEWHAIGSR
jgi:hypothetical protein